MALGRTERAVMGGVGWAPHTRTCLRLHVGILRPRSGDQGTPAAAEHGPSPPSQSKEPGPQHHCHPGLNPGVGVRQEQLCGLQSPPPTSDTWTQQRPRGQGPAPGQGTSKLERQHSVPQASPARLPRPRSSAVPTLGPSPGPHPALASPQDPEWAQGSRWSQCWGQCSPWQPGSVPRAAAAA